MTQILKFEATPRAHEIALDALGGECDQLTLERKGINTFILTAQNGIEPLFQMGPFELGVDEILEIGGITIDISIGGQT